MPLPLPSPTPSASSPSGGSIAQTAGVSLPLTGGIVILTWLCAPSWPPPQDVLLIALGIATPLVHLLGRALYRRLEAWTGEDLDGDLSPSPPPPTPSSLILPSTTTPVGASPT